MNPDILRSSPVYLYLDAFSDILIVLGFVLTLAFIISSFILMSPVFISAIFYSVVMTVIGIYMPTGGNKHA